MLYCASMVKEVAVFACMWFNGVRKINIEKELSLKGSMGKSEVWESNVTSPEPNSKIASIHQ